MINGLYSSVSAMISLESKLKLVTNNIANSNTAGYKYEDAVFKTFEAVNISNKDNKNKVIGDLNYGVKVDDTITNFTQGAITETGNKTDFAINGSGFFVVQNEYGENFYTRQGNFFIDKQGYLVTQSGNYVLGTNNNGDTEKIYVGNNSMDLSNGVLKLNSIPTYKFNIVDFEDYNDLRKMGENLYKGTEFNVLDNPNIIQSNIESSNVDIVKEVTSMMEITRQYETNQKILQTIDSVLDKSANQIGVVR